MHSSEKKNYAVTTEMCTLGEARTFNSNPLQYAGSLFKLHFEIPCVFSCPTANIPCANLCDL